MSGRDNGGQGVGEGVRNITLGKIFGYLCGIFLLLAGIGSLRRGFGGVFILLGGLFALPPIRAQLRQQSRISFSRWAVVFTVMILIGVGGATLSVTSSTPADQSPVHDLGDEFTVGTGEYAVQYRILDTFLQERVGLRYFSENADGKFLVVILEMKNVGDEPFGILDRQLRVVDLLNRTYEADFEASLFADNDPRIDAEGIVYERLNPGFTVERAVVFDANPGSEYRLHIDPVGVFSGADEHVVPLGADSA